MIPDKSFNPKYQLLQYGDIVEVGDEWYDPIKDRWVLVDSELDEGDDYFVGDPWDSDEMKPMRRRNPDWTQPAEDKSEWTNTPLERPTRLGFGSSYIDSAVEETRLARDWKEDPPHPCDFD